MSNEVDNRVVTMTFDNAKFASKMEETIKGLGKLNESLKMTEGVKGMADVQKHVNSFNTSGIQKAMGEAQGAVGKFNTSTITNAMGDAQKAVNSFDASNMSDQADGVSAKWVAMAAAIFATVDGLVTKIGAAAVGLSKSFSLGPISDGFSEYETNIGSIQTILANTDRYGTKLPEVTASLDELNTYSDKTIYNFGEMVKNIGLFTNAGIRVGDATSMIKGFSNAAAASGTTAEGAAGAAYQLSQALSQGTIRLMDWRSLTNVGMGNKNMQQGIIEIADSMGTLKKAGLSSDEVGKHFNETLQKGWLSADVMSNYLKIMAGDMDDAKMKALGLDETQIKWFRHQQQISEDAATKVRTFHQLIGTVKESIGSGWSETFRTVIGDFEGATKLFTGLNNGISKIVGHSADARNKMLKIWAHFGGNFQLARIFINTKKAIMSVIDPIRWAFRAMFPRATAGMLLKMGEAINKFMVRIRLSGDGIKRVASIFGAFFAVLKIFWMVVKGVMHVLGAFLGVLFKNKGSSGLLDIVAKIGRGVVVLEQILQKHNTIGTFFDKIADSVTWFGNIVNKVLSFVFHIIGNLGKASWAALSKTGAGFVWIGKKVYDFENRMISGAKTVIAAVKQIFGVFLHNKLPKGGPFEDGKGSFVSKLFTFRDKVAHAYHGVANALRGGMGSVKEVFGVLKNGDFEGVGPWSEDSPFISKLLAFHVHAAAAFHSIAGTFSAGYHAIVDVVKSGASLLGGAASSAVGSIGDFFSNLFGGGKGKSSKSTDEGEKKVGKITRSLDKVTKAADKVTHSLKKTHDSFDLLTKRQPDQSFGGMIGGMVGAGDAAKKSGHDAKDGASLWDKFLAPFKWAGKVIGKLADVVPDALHKLFGGIGDALASKNLEKAIKDGGLIALFKMGLNFSEFFKNFLSFKGINSAIGSVTSAMDQAKDTFKTYQRSLRWKILRNIAIAVALLAASMAGLSFLDPKKLAAGAGAVGGALLGIVVSMKQMDKLSGGRKKLNATATTIRKIGEAILLLALSVKILGDMKDRGNLIQGLIGVNILLAGLTGAVLLMGMQKKKMDGVAETLIGLAAGLFLLTASVYILGKMNDKGDLAQGLIAVTVLLAGLGGAIRLMGDKSELAGVAISLVAIGVSMILLAKAVADMGKMDEETITRGIVGLAAGLLVIIGALKLMNTLELEKAGLGMLLLAYSLKGIAKVIQIFASMSWGELLKGMVALTVALGVISLAMNAMDGAALGAVAMLVMSYALGIFVDVMERMAKMSWGTIGKGLLGIALALVVIGGTAALLGLVSPLIAGFGVALLLVGVGMLAFGAGAALVASAITSMLHTGQKGVPIFISILKKMIAALPGFAGALADAILKAISNFLEGVPQLIDQFKTVLVAILNAVIEITPLIFELIKVLLQGILDIMIEIGPQFIDAGFLLFTTFLTGLTNALPQIVDFVITLLDTLVQALVDNATILANGAINLFLVFVNTIIGRMPEIVLMGVSLIVSLLKGITDNLNKIGDAVATLIITLIYQVGTHTQEIIDAGVDMIVHFLSGFRSNVKRVSDALALTAVSVIHSILSALTDAVVGITQEFVDFIVTFLDRMGSTMRSGGPEIGRAIRSFAGDFVAAVAGGIDEALGHVNWLGMLKKAAGSLFGAFMDAIDAHSPSRMFAKGAKSIPQGIAKGIDDNAHLPVNSVKGMVDGVTGEFDKSLNSMASSLMDKFNGLDNIEPVIAPVIDMTNVKMGVDKIGSMLDGSTIAADVSLDSARMISAATAAANESATTPVDSESGGDLIFYQYNTSPKSLSEADIYRNTKGQVARAKEELKI